MSPRPTLVVAILLASAIGALAASPAGEADPFAVEVPADAPPDHASPSVCAVILGRQYDAVSDGKASGDKAALAAGFDAFRAESIRLNDGQVGADQMIGSSIAFYDELTPEQLSAATQMCLAAVGQTFTVDE